MNKNKLLEIPLIEGSDEVMSEYIGNIRIMTAQIKIVGHKKVLNLDVYEKEGLKARFFYTGKERLAYIPESEKWTTKSFYKVLDGDYYYWKNVQYAYRFFNADMRLKVEKFFKKYTKEGTDTLAALNTWEYECDCSKRQAKRKKQERIERRENTLCNPLPRKMKKWLTDKLPVYLFQKTTGETTCSACGTTVMMDAKKHLSEMKCPHCKRKATIQRLNRCKRRFFSIEWGLLYDTNKEGEKVERYVMAKKGIVIDKKKQTFQFFVDDYGERARVYRNRPYSKANFELYGNKWCLSTKKFLSTGGLFHNTDFCGCCYFYPYNQSLWMQNIISDENKAWLYLTQDLSNPKVADFYERLSKADLGGLANKLVFSWESISYLGIDLNRTSLIENLGLNKKTLSILKKCQTIEAMKFLRKIPDIPEENFWTWTNMFGFSSSEYLRFKNPMKVCRYIKEQTGDGYKGVLNSYTHYLDLIDKYGEELGINPRAKSVRYPKDFAKADANLTRDYNALVAKKKAEQEALYNKNYAEMAEELKAAMHKSKDIKKFLNGTSGLLVKIPETREELIKEGNRLHNCLATYAERMAEGKTTIFFIRKLDDPDKEYFAMEYLDGEIKQLYTYGNTEDKEGKVVAFADAFAAMLKKTHFQPPKLAA